MEASTSQHPTATRTSKVAALTVLAHQVSSLDLKLYQRCAFLAALINTGVFGKNHPLISDVFTSILLQAMNSSQTPVMAFRPAPCTRSKLTVAELKKDAAEAGLPISGTKQQLLARVPMLAPPLLVKLCQNDRREATEAILPWVADSDDEAEMERYAMNKQNWKKMKERHIKEHAICCYLYDSRKQELVEALRSRGLQLRRDSRLCKEYIRYGNETLNFVVDTMDEMRFYFQKTNYVRWRQHENDMFYREYGGMDSVDRDTASHNAKLEALKEFAQGKTVDQVENDASIPASLKQDVLDLVCGGPRQ